MLLRTTTHISLAALTLVAALALGGRNVTGGTSRAEAKTGTSPLALALTLGAPGGGAKTYSFEFTDDRAIEKALGFDFTRGATDAQFQRYEARAFAAGNIYATPLTKLWSGGDVVWESTAGIGPPTQVTTTALRPSLNLGPIARKLTRCHYRARRIIGAELYSATIKQVLACGGDFGDAVPIETQIAIDTARHIVFASNSRPAIAGAVRGADDLHKNRDLSGALAPLAGDPSVTVSSGHDYCRSLTRDLAGPHPTPQEIVLAKHKDPAGAPYAALAFGIRLAPARATARIVLHYASPGAARSDLALRKRALTTGLSFAAQEPYARLLTLRDATTTGADALLDVTAAGAAPLRLANMWSHNDLAFARC